MQSSMRTVDSSRFPRKRKGVISSEFYLYFISHFISLTWPLCGLESLNNVRLPKTNPPLTSKYIKANINTNV